MKRKTVEQKNLHYFLEGVLSAKIQFKPLAALIPIDTTSVPTLRTIREETANSRSIDDRILFQTSSKLLDVFARVQKDYQKMNSPNFKEQMEDCYSSLNNRKQIIDKRVNMKLVERKERNQKTNYLSNYLMQDQNNQNQNTINVQVDNKSKEKNVKPPKKINIDCKLVEIVRPQYKKSPQDIKRPDRQAHADVQMTPIQIRTNRTYVTESSDSQDIPIVRNSINSHRETNPKLKRKSVSPKHENRNMHHLNNISAISKNYQTQTDHSFEIDLYGMGFVAERPKADPKPLHHVYLIKGEASGKEKAGKLEAINTGIKVQSQKIQEQEPWECDEEEIEQEIRQINEKLRQKAYYTQRNKTQSDEWRSKRRY